MHVIEAANAHMALVKGLRYLASKGIPEMTRNDAAIVAPGPVTTVYSRPWERVVFWPERDANPYFHFFEALWMLAGRNDVDFPAQFVSRMKTFSDDGVRLHGAYGHRWRKHFAVMGEEALGYLDQLKFIVDILTKNTADRRCVLTMWDPDADLGKEGRDFPCNTHIYFRVNSNGQLDMTVCCRSNDLIWGAYGANFVHMSFLQEYIARHVGVQMGRYWQVSNNYHAYQSVFIPLWSKLSGTSGHRSPYDKRWKRYDIIPLISGNETMAMFDADLFTFFQYVDQKAYNHFSTKFFLDLVSPLWLSFKAYKEKDFDAAFIRLGPAGTTDWGEACAQWLKRREQRRKHAEDDGVNYEQ